MDYESWAYAILWLSVIAAAVMHWMLVDKTKCVDREIRGVIKTRQHLMLAKEAINLSMRMAIYYLAMCGAVLVLYLVLVAKGLTYISVIGKMFIFGIITLPMGLIAKHFEKRIKDIRVESDDPTLDSLFSDYLDRWHKPQFQIKE